MIPAADQWRGSWKAGPTVRDATVLVAVAAAGAMLVLLAVAGLAVTRAVLRPLRGTAQSAAVAAPTAFRATLNRISEQMDASRTAEAAARRSAVEMSERLSEVSLELRTPVSIVRGFAEYYRQRGRPRPPAGDPMMRRAADEITRIETLVARLDVHSPHIPPGRPDRD